MSLSDVALSRKPFQQGSVVYVAFMSPERLLLQASKPGDRRGLADTLIQHAERDGRRHACSLAILANRYGKYPVNVQNGALRWFAVNRLRVALPTVRTLVRL